jgi:septal ring factor EnvC (AmiA/AmiB activator)
VKLGHSFNRQELYELVWSEPLKTAPEDLEPLARFGNDIFIVWDAEDSISDVFLHAAISIARALCANKSSQRDEQQVDFETIERAIRDIEKQAQGLDQITGWANTINSNSTKILDRAQKMKDNLEKQISVIDENFNDMKKAFATANQS